MKPIKNIETVQEAGDGGKRLPAGGYICKYTKVEDNPDKEYLYMEYDIAEGEYKGYYAELEERLDFWGGKCYRSYKPAALPMFKRMCSAVTKSNKKFIFDGNDHADEKTLVGKLVGMVFGEEEYIGNDGSTKTRLYVVRETSIEDIKEGKYKVPEIKKIKPAATESPAFEDVNKSDAEEVPFD